MEPARTLIAAAVLVSGIYSTAVLACSSMGSSTHAGKIMSVDEATMTFTIMDLQTMSPVTFNADKNMMQQIMNAKGTAIVDYTGEGEDLTATGLQMQ